MRGIGSLVSQWRAVRAPVGLVLAASLISTGGVLLLHGWKGIPIGHLTRDPANITLAPAYLGLLSHAGIVLWSAAAAICFFSATLILVRGPGAESPAPYLYASGVFTVVLMLDDLFLLHESVAPRYEVLLYGGYAMVAALHLLVFRRAILRTEYLLLGLALFLFGLAVAFDAFLPVPVGDPYLVEDGTKFAGIVTWLVYFTRVSARAVEGRHSRAE